MASNSLLSFNQPKRPKFLPGTEGLLGGANAAPGLQEFIPQQQQFSPQQQQTQSQPTSFADFAAMAGKNNKLKDPATGKKVNPTKAFSNYLAKTGADEARNFSFQDLPDVGIDSSIQGLLGAGRKAGEDREAALREVAEMQARALAPNLDPETRRFFQDMADERRAEVQSRFAEGGDVYNQFERQGAANLAQLANRGVIDTTTGSQALARQNVDLAALMNNLLNQASEQSRQDVLDERTGIRGAATEFGKLQGDIANVSGQLAQQGLGTAGQLGLQNRQLESELQLAEVGQRLLGNQTALQNIQSLVNNRFNRRQAREMAELQKQLIEDQLNNGLFGGITKDLFGISPTQALGFGASAALGGRSLG